MSTASGFVVGALAAATLTVLYGERLSTSLGEAVDRHQPGLQQPERETPVREADTALSLPETALQDQTLSRQTADSTTPPLTPEEPTLEQRWAAFATEAETLKPAGEFPWRPCFQRAAASYAIPETLLLAIASGESNFDPAARSDKDAVGLMQIRWPATSQHLGVRREADLYDPCTNVDAGARYLAELADQFDNNLHLMVAAYNYGPGRVQAGGVPEGAHWYSQYIFRHLQQVLGKQQISAGELIPSETAPGTGQQVLMRFDSSQRARDFMLFIQGQVSGLSLQQRNEALGQHDVVLLYSGESERLSALSQISAAGIATLEPQSHNKQLL